MIRRPTISTRTYTLFPDTTLFLSRRHQLRADAEEKLADHGEHPRNLADPFGRRGLRDDGRGDREEHRRAEADEDELRDDEQEAVHIDAEPEQPPRGRPQPTGAQREPTPPQPPPPPPPRPAPAPKK